MLLWITECYYKILLQTFSDFILTIINLWKRFINFNDADFKNADILFDVLLSKLRFSKF